MTDINIKSRARSDPGKYDIVSYGTQSIVVIVITNVCVYTYLSIYICAIRLSYIIDYLQPFPTVYIFMQTGLNELKYAQVITKIKFFTQFVINFYQLL